MRNRVRSPSWHAMSGVAGLLVVTVGPNSHANPPTPSTTIARSAPVPHDLAPVGLPEALAHLPDDVPITIVLPSPERFFRKLEARLERVAPSASAFAHQAVLDGLVEVIGGPVQPSTFRRLGIAVDREVALISDPEAGVTIVRFALHDRRRFEAWLSRTVPEERRSMDLGRERAIVLYPDSELPIICLLRVSHAHCQIGTGHGQRPGEALSRLVSAGIRPLSDAADVQAVRPHLHEDADLMAFIRPKLLIPSVEAWADARTRRSRRFRGAAEHTSSSVHSKYVVRVARSWLGGSRLLAFSFAFDRGAFDTRMHAILEGPAAARLGAFVSSEAPEAVLATWSQTPALARLLMRLEPSAASALLEALGLDLSADALNGTVSALLLGVDSECQAARSLVKDPRAHLFYLPMAVALGLRAPVDARRMFRSGSEGESTSLFSGVRFREGADPRTLQAEHFGSSLEVRVLERVLLMGTGEGTVAAAERRWDARIDRPSNSGGFLELSVDLSAVRAALASARIERSSDDLKRLRAMEQKLDLWMAHMRRVDLHARMAESAPQLSVEFSGR